MSQARSSDLRFFTIGNDRYFPGVVGLCNSLRLCGHDEPIIIADCGLTEAQRKVLAPHCTLFAVPPEAVINPQQYKPFPYLLDPSGIVAIIDSDMIVTRSLNTYLDHARAGHICLFPDPEPDRWFAEWQEIFALRTPPRRQTYGCTGFVAFSTRHWPLLLARWWAACARISNHPTYQERVADGPVTQADQDALNALLMSEYPSEAAAFLPEQDQVFRWDFGRVDVVDADTLECRHNGHRPAILHACMTPKPWQRRGLRRNVYVRLLRRLLTAADVAIRVPPETLAPWLRPGPIAELACHALSAANMTNPDDGALPPQVVDLARRVKRTLIRPSGAAAGRTTAQSGH